MLGITALLLALVGIPLPLLPTTPFLILAAFFFSRSHPEWEQRLLAHPACGPAILAWRRRRAIPLVAKRLATLLLSLSAFSAYCLQDGIWAYLPGLIGLLVLSWMWSRPSQ